MLPPSAASQPWFPLSPTTGKRGQNAVICLLLVALVLIAYGQAGSLGFVNLDDDAYVEFQPMVNQGLRPAAVIWAWTATHSNNWHPLTSLSHMIDCSLFGLSPGPMHWENVIWHALNTLLVFWVWQAASGAPWRSSAVAAFFALHPAHVESVAWISERKDVLSTFFWLAGLGAYLRYVRLPSTRRYLLVVMFFVLSLLAKPMTVTFPLTLLLMDFWPLRRWDSVNGRRLFIEKLPFFGLAAVHAAITLAVQVSTGAANYGERFSLAARVGNALVSVIRYLGKSVWPFPLAPHYDHPGWWPWWAIAGSGVLITGIVLLAWRQQKSRPWLLFGWAWFLITLLPVIGIIQVGAQAMADRYTYVSYLGLFTFEVWALGAIVKRYPGLRIAAVTVSAAVAGIFAVWTREQASAWKDSVSLYQRSIAAGTDNATLRYLLAVHLQSAGAPEEEVATQFRRTIELSPSYVNAYTQLALIALNHRSITEAENLVMKTVRLEPRNPACVKNLGVLKNMQGRSEEAATHFSEALRLHPDYQDARLELARMHAGQGRMPEAVRELEKVVQATPWDFAVRSELGALYIQLGRREDARQAFERAVWIHPGHSEAAARLRDLTSTTFSQPSQ